MGFEGIQVDEHEDQSPDQIEQQPSEQKPEDIPDDPGTSRVWRDDG